ncbi:hypothetical protein THASP1DRAFT_27800 [Thamnocephalis sphaerospora]|uniref:Uncharacterized protein n=1 Tax=Thamnocephalis sphaerospora TaxID=78915 RepID=A0A4P9XVW2_9FUNG|nr:hypothetical protein THASP1DRAFT_27800 [Thamnocephalis sphaerospora]|eukprot:RKP10428.1 hypothetical protein THASP1DRAFT_27800 [Thamnocephalis sphaerospora]
MSTSGDKPWALYTSLLVLLFAYIIAPIYYLLQFKRRLPAVRHRGPTLIACAAFSHAILIGWEMTRLVLHIHVSCHADMWIQLVGGVLAIGSLCGKAWRLILLYRLSEARFMKGWNKRPARYSQQRWRQRMFPVLRTLTTPCRWLPRWMRCLPQNVERRWELSSIDSQAPMGHEVGLAPREEAAAAVVVALDALAPAPATEPTEEPCGCAGVGTDTQTQARCSAASTFPSSPTPWATVSPASQKGDWYHRYQESLSNNWIFYNVLLGCLLTAGLCALLQAIPDNVPIVGPDEIIFCYRTIPFYVGYGIGSLLAFLILPLFVHQMIRVRDAFRIRLELTVSLFTTNFSMLQSIVFTFLPAGIIDDATRSSIVPGTIMAAYILVHAAAVILPLWETTRFGANHRNSSVVLSEFEAAMQDAAMLEKASP